MVATIDGVMAGLMDEFTEADPESKRPPSAFVPSCGPTRRSSTTASAAMPRARAWQVLEDDQVTAWREVKFADAAADVMERRMHTDPR
jgi:hypothetical protein